MSNQPKPTTSLRTQNTTDIACKSCHKFLSGQEFFLSEILSKTNRVFIDIEKPWKKCGSHQLLCVVENTEMNFQT